MTEQASSPTPDGPEPRPQRCKGRGRFAFFAILLALAAGIAGVAITKAVSHAHGSGRGFMHGAMDPATAGKRAERAMRHLAIEVDASPEQTAKLVAIAQGAVKDLLPVRDQLIAGRGQIKDLLLSASVDKASIEKLRTEKLALADQATRRLTQALADASEVLNVEQRRKLAERIEAFRERREGWGFRRWMHRG